MPNPNFFQIGTSAGGAGGMTTMRLLGLPSPLADFQEFSEEIPLPDGSALGAGWTVAEWHWDYLTADQYNELVAYKTGKSTPVYIRTRKMQNEYATFFANMIWPERERWESNCVIDFTIRFVALVEQ